MPTLLTPHAQALKSNHIKFLGATFVNRITQLLFSCLTQYQYL